MGGLTAQNYKELNTLYDKYSGEGLEILAFPCNQFGAQEPGTNAEVLQFAQRKGAKFPVMAKVDVNGAGAHPLFTWLKDNTSTGFPPLKDIPWNFGKFLIDREGTVTRPRRARSRWRATSRRSCP